jgi:hypothetical protein
MYCYSCRLIAVLCLVWCLVEAFMELPIAFGAVLCPGILYFLFISISNFAFNFFHLHKKYFTICVNFIINEGRKGNQAS